MLSDGDTGCDARRRDFRFGDAAGALRASERGMHGGEDRCAKEDQCLSVCLMLPVVATRLPRHPADPSRPAAACADRRAGRRREIGMDDWAWEQLQPWLTARVELPVGPLFCIITGPTRGRRWSIAAARPRVREAAAAGRGPCALRSPAATDTEEDGWVYG